MMRLILLLSLVLSSCASTIHYSTPRVVDYPIRSYTPEDVQQVVDYVENVFQESIRGWTIKLVDNWIHSQIGFRSVAITDGITDERKKLIVVFAWTKCLAASALIHEILHAMEFPVHGEQAQAPVKKIKQQAIESMCPGYEEETIPPPYINPTFMEDRSPVFDGIRLNSLVRDIPVHSNL